MKRLLQLVLLFAALAWCVPAHATITFVQVHSNVACGNVTTCTVTGFTAIPAGSFIVARASASVSFTFSSGAASNAGTWTIPSGCTTNTACNENDATAGSVVVEYILSSTGTPTSIVVGTASGANIADVSVAVYSFTGSSMAFDVGSVRDQTVTGTSYAGTSAGTLTGTNDIILQYGTTNGNFSVCPNSAASPNDFTNGNALCGLVNSTNNAAGTFTLSTTGRAALGAIAFKEAAAVGGATGFDKRRRYESVDE